jgi:hypothetical protein
MNQALKIIERAAGPGCKIFSDPALLLHRGNTHATPSRASMNNPRTGQPFLGRSFSLASIKLLDGIVFRLDKILLIDDDAAKVTNFLKFLQRNT